MVTDENTANKHRVSYACLLVEVNITKELPYEIISKDNKGMEMKQVIEYEWGPLYCERCQKA